MKVKSSKKPTPKKKGSWLGRLIVRTVLLGLFVFTVSVLVFLVVYFKPAHDRISQGLPSEDYSPGYGQIYYGPVETYNPKTDEAKAKVNKMTAVTTGKDKPQKRIAYSAGQWPGPVVAVLLATEDREFYSHPGINLKRAIGAAVKNIQVWRLKEGASTLTQQISKGYFLTIDKTFDRKFREWGFALAIETAASKDEIFAMYCNGVNLGQAVGGYAIVGFGEAAEYYFGEKIHEYNKVNPKNLAHIASLVALLKGPSWYSAYGHPDRLLQRRNLVIDNAVGFEFKDPKGQVTVVTREMAEQAKKLPLGVKNQQAVAATDGGVQYAVKPVEKQLERVLPKADLARLNVYSTIIEPVQKAAMDVIKTEMPHIERELKNRGINPQGVQVALVAMESGSGAVVASVGGRNFADSQLDRVNEGRMTPGSAFKPFVYWKAFNLEGSQFSPLTELPDEMLPDYFGPGKPGPNNFGGKPSGKSMTLRYGLTKSENTIAVRLIKEVKPKLVSDFAEELGLPRPQDGLASALGVSTANPFQVARAYIPLSRGDGQLVEPSYIRRVTSEDGKTLYRLTPEPRQVSSPESVFLTTNILRDVLDKGTGSQVRAHGFKSLAAGKTGTSRDAWFVGYTPKIVCAVWIGFDEGVTLELTGGSTSAIIWVEFMKKLQAIMPWYFQGTWEKPEGILQAQYQMPDGKLGTEYFLAGYQGLAKVEYLQPDGQKGYKYFVKGSEPTAIEPQVIQVQVVDEGGGVPPEIKPLPRRPTEGEELPVIKVPRRGEELPVIPANRKRTITGGEGEIQGRTPGGEVGKTRPPS